MIGNPEKTINRRLLAGLAAGVLLGLGLNAWGAHPARDSLLRNVLDPIGQIFLRGLFATVVPLVFCSVAAGLSRLGTMAHIRRLGGRLVMFYAATSLIAILIGQALVTTVRPGDGVPRELVERAQAELGGQLGGLMDRSAQVRDSLWPGLVQMLIPRNLIQALAEGQMLAVVFASLVFGLALLALDRRQAEPAIGVLESLSACCLTVVGWIMKLAPVAVAALVASTLARFGFDIVRQIGLYVAVVIGGYAIHFFVTYSVILRAFVRMPVREFYRRALTVLMTAFSTSSSNATIPTTIRTLERRFGVPESITTFSVPVGATVNMDGTALFEAVVVVFVAQVFGIELSWMQHATIVALVFLTAIGVAGVPGGSIPLIMSIMASVGVPPEGIALILGVDRLLDMGRTVLNVTGDLLCALFLARTEGVALAPNGVAADAR